MPEIERKYVVRNGASPYGARLWVLRALGRSGFRVQRDLHRSFRDTYLDTDMGALRKAGWQYRMRVGDGDPVLTLKEVRAPRDALFTRVELTEACGSGKRPRAVCDQLAQLLPEGVLPQPLFTQRTDRRTVVLTPPERDEAVIEFAFDRVVADSGTYFELEFELPRGAESVLDRLDALLEENADLIPARMSKMQRGLFLCGKEPLGREPGERSSWYALGLENAGLRFSEFLELVPYAWESVHPEGVHRLRVAARKLVAALDTFAGEFPHRETRALAAPVETIIARLGALRDLHVIAESAPAGAAGVELARQLRVAHAELNEVLQEQTLADLAACYDALVYGAASERRNDAAAGLSDGVRSILLPGTRGLAREIASMDWSNKELHRVRRTAKHLRYQFMCLPPHERERFRDSMNALKELHEVLGSHQDRRVIRGWHRRHGGRADPKPPMTKKQRKRVVAAARQLGS